MSAPRESLGELLRAGRLEEALPHLRAAADAEPGDAAAHANLGAALLALGRADEAVGALERARDRDPELPGVAVNLGTALKAAGRPGEAVATLRDALARDPDQPAALYALGSALKASGDPDAAHAAYARLVAVAPEWPEAWLNLGTVQQERNDFTEALASYDRAAALRPDWHLPHHNRAQTFLRACDPRAAVPCFRAAIERAPDHRLSHHDLAMTLVQLGAFDEGWRRYEWRWGLGGRTATLDGVDAPVWDGEDVGGARFLLWAEQGFGDAIQFARFAEPLAARGADVTVWCKRALTGLLARARGVARANAGPGPGPGVGTGGAFDFQLPMMSAPRVFGLTADTVPARVPYVDVEPVELPELAGPGRRVGVVWRSGPLYRDAAARDARPEDLAPLARIDGVRLAALQHEPTDAERASAAALGIPDLSGRLTDFEATARVVAALDAVVTVDTAALHVAGALGVPTFALLPRRADWRWMEDGTSTIWYPSVRLARQTAAGDWSGPVAAVARALSEGGPRC